MTDKDVPDSLARLNREILMWNILGLEDTDMDDVDEPTMELQPSVKRCIVVLEVNDILGEVSEKTSSEWCVGVANSLLRLGMLQAKESSLEVQVHTATTAFPKETRIQPCDSKWWDDEAKGWVPCRNEATRIVGSLALCEKHIETYWGS